jgi:hypothetical protein
MLSGHSSEGAVCHRFGAFGNYYLAEREGTIVFAGSGLWSLKNIRIPAFPTSPKTVFRPQD